MRSEGRKIKQKWDQRKGKQNRIRENESNAFTKEKSEAQKKETFCFVFTDEEKEEEANFRILYPQKKGARHLLVMQLGKRKWILAMAFLIKNTFTEGTAIDIQTRNMREFEETESRRLTDEAM